MKRSAFNNMTLKCVMQAAAILMIAAMALAASSCLNNYAGDESGSAASTVSEKGKVGLTFISDGKSVNLYTGAPGTPLAAPVAPEKEGCRFVRWDPEVPNFYPEESATYEAVWIENGKYLIEYVLDGGTNGDNPSVYTAKDLPVKLKAAEKAGYIFDGWYTDLENHAAKVEVISAQEEMKDMVLFAKWIEPGSITYYIHNYFSDDEGNYNEDADKEEVWVSPGDSYNLNLKRYDGFRATRSEFKERLENAYDVNVYYDKI